MDNPCDPIAVGVFHRQDIAAISAGQDTIRQHIRLGLEQILQNLADLAFLF